jgi:hypothetical protein
MKKSSDQTNAIFGRVAGPTVPGVLAVKIFVYLAVVLFFSAEAVALILLMKRAEMHLAGHPMLYAVVLGTPLPWFWWIRGYISIRKRMTSAENRQAVSPALYFFAIAIATEYLVLLLALLLLVVGLRSAGH